MASRHKTETTPVTYVFALEQNRPNPFRQLTEIRYQLPKQESVLLKIYNINGQLVKTVVNAPRNAGIYSAKWDGRDARGQSVASGIYFYTLNAGEASCIKKLMVLR